jgi:biopolymer transport protein ExbB
MALSTDNQKWDALGRWQTGIDSQVSGDDNVSSQPIVTREISWPVGWKTFRPSRGGVRGVEERASMQFDRIGDARQKQAGLGSVAGSSFAGRYRRTTWLSLLLGGWLIAALPLAAGIALTAAPAVAVAQDEFLEDDLPADPAEEAAPEGQNLLMFFVTALGPTFSVVFLLISFALVSLVVMGFLQLRQSAMMPPDMVEEFNAHLDAKEWQQAYELASEDGSYLGQVLAAGIGKVSSGYTAAIDAMRDAAANESMRLEHQLSYVGLIGALAPMIGLLGTVWGMVKSFMEIAASTTSPKPAKLAEGISTALITTLIGLVIAIVAVAVFAFFKNRLQSLNAAVDDEAMKVMSRFSKRSTASAAPTASA